MNNKNRTNGNYQKKRIRLIERQVKEKGYNWCTMCNHPVYREINPNDSKMLTIDHVVPWSRGGTNSISNLRVACYECNKRKGAND